MKYLRPLFLATAVLLSATAQAADTQGPASGTVSGEVLETQDAAGYTYLRLKTASGETWAAVNQTAVKKGAKVTLENTMVMSNFESKALKKNFASIVFGNLQGSAPEAGSARVEAPGMKPELAAIKVGKAMGPNAHTVAEVATQAQTLKDKPVVVHGKVVKYNAGIMGKNWVHLRDGTGKEADGSNDVLVTTQASTQVGAEVTVSGTLHTNKDFGSGYSYKVLIEDASLK